jgi:hypothetical protein
VELTDSIRHWFGATLDPVSDCRFCGVTECRCFFLTADAVMLLLKNLWPDLATGLEK